MAGMGVALGWMWICHPTDAQNVVVSQTDAHDLATLGVMLVGALMLLTVITGAWMLIVGIMAKLAGLCLVVAFGFGCFIAYRTYQDNHESAPVGLEALDFELNPAPIAATEPMQPSSTYRGPWWNRPHAP
jgi:hypothetical protein